MREVCLFGQAGLVAFILSPCWWAAGTTQKTKYMHMLTQPKVIYVPKMSHGVQMALGWF
jgi:hypothetical protein